MNSIFNVFMVGSYLVFIGFMFSFFGFWPSIAFVVFIVWVFFTHEGFYE
mgnify:CR=1 FL=1|jgi:hypothetical protein